ncbi:arylamine N-acetyltransferase, pineal gland isozyme NAT-10-like isoform X2 [Colossoma macropomum]|uniref:arylamine N-acetyltransferase, pineal gland isozyme NAT-10-like isoform X2 n=1 Tax=Colossoma macropomum TaxID=42526 RepID=UPI00186417F2|nr:arylamine N-acetyltransferase, pineal gland isozyme NAT-10-like isoform X2 [Colossoma macropomum]
MFWQHLLPSRRLLFQCPNFFGNGVVHYGEKLLLDVQMKSSRCSREREEAKSLLLHSRRSIMDLKEYFKRIGFTGLYDKADLPTLCTIHKLHVMTVPFENLSIHCGEKNTLDLNVIYKKIVLDHRGGWCFENNLLFSWVLREMGYKFTMLGTKDCNLLKNDSNPMESHLINLVEIDGKPYIADVSYGVSDQMWEPLELIAGKDQPQPPGVFRLLKDGESWTLEKTGRKPLIQNEAFAKCSLVNKPLTKTMFSFFLMPRGTDQFLEASEYLQTNCESLFTQKSICSLQTPTGFRALVGCNYSEVTFNPQEDVDLYDMRKIPDSEIETVLKEKFNITLDSKLTPVNNKNV